MSLVSRLTEPNVLMLSNNSSNFISCNHFHFIPKHFLFQPRCRYSSHSRLRSAREPPHLPHLIQNKPVENLPQTDTRLRKCWQIQI